MKLSHHELEDSKIKLLQMVVLLIQTDGILVDFFLKVTLSVTIPGKKCLTKFLFFKIISKNNCFLYNY